MEPLSAVASVITLLGTANSIVHLVKAFGRVPETIQCLVDEVRVSRALFSDVLEVQGLMDKASQKPTILLYLAQATPKLDEIERILMPKMGRSLSGKHHETRHMRLHWFKYQSRIALLQTELQSINTSLNTSLTAAMLRHQVHLRTSIEEIALLVKQTFSYRSHAGDKRIMTTCAEYDLDALLPLQGDSKLLGSTQSSPLLDKRPQHLCQGVSTDKEDARETKAVDSGAALLSTDSTRRTEIWEAVAGCTCIESCPCHCHTKRRMRTLDLLTFMVGSVSLSFSESRPHRLCSYIDCRGRLSSTLNMTWHFPTWLMPQILNLSIRYGATGSPSMTIRMPRIRPDTAIIFHLATAGDIEGMKTMFARGLASPDDVSYTYGYSVLHFAVDIESVETIHFLLSIGADSELANRLNLTAADLAWNRILSKRMDSVKIESMSTAFGTTNIADQIENRKLTRLQQSVLCLNGVDLDLLLEDASLSEINGMDADGNTVLSWAARSGNEYAMCRLLARGASVDHVSRYGSTALHYAAGAWSPSCILPLLEAGADPNTRNTCLRETPLHVATLRHDEPDEFLAPFIEKGADINAYDHEGSTVLAFAVQANHYCSAKYLLDHGADTNAADHSGLTPVGLAVVYGHQAILKLLVEYGANLGLVNDAGETAIHLCAIYGSLDTVATLEQVTMDISIQTLNETLDAQGLRASDHALRRGDESFMTAFDGFITRPSPVKIENLGS